MARMVRDLPKDERPREKLLRRGAVFLSDAELLAILLRTGTKTQSALHLAEEVLTLYGERGICSLMSIAPKELAEIKGIGEAKAATILAAVELGKRFFIKEAEQKKVIKCAEDAAKYAMPHFRYAEKEHFAVLLLDTKHAVIGMPIISVGTVSASLVHQREVFRAAVKNAASAIILVHNHPSGNVTPSKEDINVTKMLAEAGKVMGIEVIDHIILGDNDFASLREFGILE